ncbi:MAG: hypothetical protein BGO96_11630 [Micrococcales bacterium 73-15]|uniref:ThiF family adenylyltransferase n=1 Tax=Salana multivorans TaxID=120377 RepID=UPI0009686994|nr:ThiF family adenylyltransferase [Salana multivorans]OJX95459.1 MAG: hypothetical protein BGO96_11630 [Micrococcales bacterium 73-15]
MRLPAIVEPGPPLSAAEAERTARHARLPELGELGQRRLHAARVLVLGAGGLGAPALLYLAAAGIGAIGIVDDDQVDVSNLHRQVIHGVEDVGGAKTASAARRLREVAPSVEVVEVRERLTPEVAADVIGGGWDVVLDGTDNFATRYLVSDTCARLGVPLVWASVLRFDAQVAVFWTPAADRADARGFPDGVAGVTLRDLFPEPPAPGSVPSCAEAGVLGALCGMVGSMMALEAIKLVAGIGEVLLGRVAVVDGLTLRVHDVPLRPADHDATPPRARPAPSTALPRTGPAAAVAAPAGPLVDVREPAEAAEAGDGLAGAVVVPIGVIEQAARSADPIAALAVAGLPPTVSGDDVNHLRLYCRSGARAQRGARLLRSLGVPAVALPPEDVDRLRAASALTDRPEGAPR